MEPIIKVENLSLEYHKQQVLKDVSFEIFPGECVVIVGPSGAGKSTALRAIAGIEEISAGKVVYKNEDFVTPKGNQKHLNGDIGMVFQQFNLFPHLTAKENITLAPKQVLKKKPDEADKIAEGLLDKVGLSERKDYYPFELSGGQQQRVAISRALAMNPSLMLFDEPTSALDPEYTREVLEVIRGVISSGMTVVLVTHEMAFAKKMADRVIFMEDGEVRNSSGADEFFNYSGSIRVQEFLEQGNIE